MLLFKYGRFNHDSVGFDGCFLDPETKLKGRTKWSFSQDFKHPFAQASNQLIWDDQVYSGISNQLTWASYNSLGWVSAFRTKHEIRLNEFSFPERIFLHLLALFYKYSYQVRRRRSESRDLKNTKRKKKGEGGAWVLQSCDCGSHPSSFLLLIFCSTQWSVSFSKGLDVIFIPLCIFFYIIFMYESFVLIIGDFILFIMFDSIW